MEAISPRQPAKNNSAILVNDGLNIYLPRENDSVGGYWNNIWNYWLDSSSQTRDMSFLHGSMASGLPPLTVFPNPTLETFNGIDAVLDPMFPGDTTRKQRAITLQSEYDVNHTPLTAWNFIPLHDFSDLPPELESTTKKLKPTCWEHGCNGKEFFSIANLRRHQREKSGRAPKFSCSICGRTFTRSSARNNHLQKRARGQKATGHGSSCYTARALSSSRCSAE